MIARGVEAGPDESFERLRWVIIGALNLTSAFSMFFGLFFGG
jgi:hypothetical protein